MSERTPETTAPQDLRGLMEESLEVLRVYRHDLMNQVQLLRAYTQLKKYDRLEEPIHTLIAEAQRHSEWSSFPSAVMSYVVLNRDIRFPMLELHVTYEQKQAPEPNAEWLAAQLLSDMLDRLGEHSKTVFEPIPVDVWIVSFRTGYEIGWFLSGQNDKHPLSAQASMLAEKWREQGVSLRQEEAEDGMEYVLHFQRQEQAEEKSGL